LGLFRDLFQKLESACKMLDEKKQKEIREQEQEQHQKKGEDQKIKEKVDLAIKTLDDITNANSYQLRGKISNVFNEFGINFNYYNTEGSRAIDNFDKFKEEIENKYKNNLGFFENLFKILELACKMFDGEGEREIKEQEVQNKYKKEQFKKLEKKASSFNLDNSNLEYLGEFTSTVNSLLETEFENYNPKLNEIGNFFEDLNSPIQENLSKLGEIINSNVKELTVNEIQEKIEEKKEEKKIEQKKEEKKEEKKAKVIDKLSNLQISNFSKIKSPTIGEDIQKYFVDKSEIKVFKNKDNRFKIFATYKSNIYKYEMKENLIKVINDYAFLCQQDIDKRKILRPTNKFEIKITKSDKSDKAEFQERN